jgi:hypothetical protein
MKRCCLVYWGHMTKALRTIVLILLALVIVAAGAYALSTKKAHSPTHEGESGTAVPLKRYTNFLHDLRFTYPDTYALSEREAGDAHRGHYQIMLVRKADLPPPEGGEGPPSVTIDVYQNDIDRQPVMHWITTTNIANYKLGNGTLVESKVGGEAAYTNTWSGLYEGKTTTLAHDDDIVAISVTWLTPEDDTIDAYEQVVNSLEFGEFTPPNP